MTEKNEIVLSAITDAQRTILTQKTPADAIKKRKGPRNKMIPYVEHAWVTEQLNLAFGWGWSWEIKETILIPSPQDVKEVSVLGKLTIHTPKGDLAKMQYGSAVMKDKVTVGARLKAASSDGLKKAASLLGLALDLYRTTPLNGEEREEPITRPLDPEYLRKSMEMKTDIYAGKEFTEKQLGLVVGMLELCFAGQNDSDKKRRSVLSYLFGKDSAKDLIGPHVLALLDWLNPTEDSGGAFAPDPMAAQEAGLIVRQHMLDSGQGELPI